MHDNIGNKVSVNKDGKLFFDNPSFGKQFISLPNSSIANSSVTVAGNTVSLGGSTPVSAADLSDVASPNATSAGQLLIYDSTDGQFENSTLASGSGISITNADASVTVDVAATLTSKTIDGATIATSLTFNDAVDITFNTTTGTKIGTGTGQKIGFYNATPVTQQTAPSSLTDNSGGSKDNTVEAVSGSGADTAINNNFAELTEEVNQIRTVLTSLGLAA